MLLTWANHPNPTPDPKHAHQRALSYTSALFSVWIWCRFENHIKLISASGKLDCLVSRLQKCICVCKHYKMTGCSMKSQSCLIMTEWGLILPLRSRHSKLPPTCTPCWQTQRKKLETWQRMRTHTHPPPSPAFFRTASPSTPRYAGVIGELIGCHSMNYEFHTVYRHRWWWHSVLINQCIIIRNSWSSVDVFIFRASVPHTSNLTASITGGGRFVQRVENTLFYFCPDKQNKAKEQRLWIDEHRLQEVVQGNVYLRSQRWFVSVTCRSDCFLADISPSFVYFCFKSVSFGQNEYLQKILHSGGFNDGPTSTRGPQTWAN